MKDLPPVQRARLVAVLVGNGLLRLANLGGGALVSFYLAMLLRDDPRYHAGLLAALTAVSSGAELMGAIPFGMLADRFSPRSLLVSSAILGAAATQLFGISGLIIIFFVSRALEGLSAAAVTPAILAHLSDVTMGKKLIRGRVMGLFELSIFAGAALSGLIGSQLWEQYSTLPVWPPSGPTLVCDVWPPPGSLLMPSWPCGLHLPSTSWFVPLLKGNTWWVAPPRRM